MTEDEPVTSQPELLYNFNEAINNPGLWAEYKTWHAKQLDHPFWEEKQEWDKALVHRPFPAIPSDESQTYLEWRKKPSKISLASNGWGEDSKIEQDISFSMFLGVKGVEEWLAAEAPQIYPGYEELKPRMLYGLNSIPAWAPRAEGGIHVKFTEEGRDDVHLIELTHSANDSGVKLPSPLSNPGVLPSAMSFVAHETAHAVFSAYAPNLMELIKRFDKDSEDLLAYKAIQEAFAMMVEEQYLRFAAERCTDKPVSIVTRGEDSAPQYSLGEQLNKEWNMDNLLAKFAIMEEHARDVLNNNVPVNMQKLMGDLK